MAAYAVQAWLLGKGRDAVEDLPASILLKADANFLARHQAVELSRVCGPYLEAPLFHDDPVLGAIHHPNLGDHLLWGQYHAASPRPCGRSVGPRSEQQKHEQRDCPANGGTLPVVSIHVARAGGPPAFPRLSPASSLVGMAGSTGFEPATSGLTVQCANQAAPRAHKGNMHSYHACSTVSRSAPACGRLTMEASAGPWRGARRAAAAPRASRAPRARRARARASARSSPPPRSPRLPPIPRRRTRRRPAP
jgi:hypothetical protein